jgi:tRNA(fMet)-specific endonuclease VapC
VTRYILDTGIASDFVNRRGLVPERVKRARLDGGRIGLGTPVLAELIAGIQASNDPERYLPALWRKLAGLVLWSFDRSAAIEFGTIYAHLRRAGRPMQIPDIQLAAIALSLGDCVAVSKDSDLRAIPRLQVVNWAQP